MSETITCIFCTKESNATDEHVVPEFVGGSLVIREVCKICNDKMGSDFEGPVSRSVIFRLPRHLYGIQGKSESPINAFPNLGSTKDGSKVKVDSEFSPHIATKIEEKKLESGGVEVNLTVDASDKDKIPQIIESKIRRTAKKEWPDMSADEIDALVKKSLDSLPKEYQVQTSKPTIGYQESIDLNHLMLLMMKIAYEITFHHHGKSVTWDTSNIQLRLAIHSRDSKPQVSGTLFPQPDPFSHIEAPENNHCVILCKNLCYVRLFTISAIIQVVDGNSEYNLSEDEWVVYWFDFVKKSYEKQNLLSYISSS